MFFPPYPATRPPLSPTHLPNVFITPLSATTTAFHDMCNAACAEMSAYHCSSAWKLSRHSSVLGLNRFFVLSWLAPSFLHSIRKWHAHVFIVANLRSLPSEKKDAQEEECIGRHWWKQAPREREKWLCNDGVIHLSLDVVCWRPSC